MIVKHITNGSAMIAVGEIQGTGRLLTKFQRRQVPVQPLDIGAPFNRQGSRWNVSLVL
jgi:hypothetical protein